MANPHRKRHPVRTPAEFLALMRRLGNWSGQTPAQLEERMRADGVDPPGGLAELFGGGQLPTADVVIAFARACGCGALSQAAWIRHHARLVAEARAAAAAHPAIPSPDMLALILTVPGPRAAGSEAGRGGGLGFRPNAAAPAITTSVRVWPPGEQAVLSAETS